MRFWDSSAVVPLLVEQARTPGIQRLFEDDPAMAVWWTTFIECVSAVARLERSEALSETEVEAALHNLEALAGSWAEVVPSSSIRHTARRLLRTHALRAADALQLAAALALATPQAAKIEFVCLDDRLCSAARKEGLAALTAS